MAIGVEGYNGPGRSKPFGRLSDNDQEAFLVIDKGLGKSDLDLGVGRGWGAPEDQCLVKAIVGAPID